MRLYHASTLCIEKPDVHCRSDEYLADELMLEYKEQEEGGGKKGIGVFMHCDKKEWNTVPTCSVNAFCSLCLCLGKTIACIYRSFQLAQLD